LEQESPAGAKVGRPYRLYPKASIRLPDAKRKRFPRVITIPFTMLLYWRINTKIRHGNSAPVVDGSRQQLCIKIAAKPLQIKTWLLLTVCRNSSSSYLTTPSPTLYDIQLSHNTSVTDRQTDDRQTIHVPKVDLNGRLRRSSVLGKKSYPVSKNTLCVFYPVSIKW